MAKSQFRKPVFTPPTDDWLDQCTHFAMQFQIRLEQQHWDAAKAVADRAQEAWERLHAPKPAGDLGMSLAEVDGMDLRTINALEERGIHTLGDLLQRDPQEILAIGNIAGKTLDRLIRLARAALEGSDGQKS